MARLNKNQIAAAALAVLDAKGVAGFTIRAVADALGASPMALYYHVKDKSALVRLVVSHVSRETPPPPPTGVWRDDMMAMAHWSRESVTNHPAVGELHRVYPVITPEIIKMAERWLELWQQSGLKGRTAEQAAKVSSIAIASLVIYMSRFERTTAPKLKQPKSKARATFLKDDIEDLYEISFASMIDGLHRHLKKSRPKPSRARKSRN